MKTTNRNILIASAVVLALAGTAALASYFTRESIQAKTQAPAAIAAPAQQMPRQHVAAAHPAKPRCDDGNLVGVVAGGVGGAAVGSQLGKGNGRLVTTVGGMLGGGYLGQRYIPTANATCK